MARSMTAFARLETTGPWGRASWELRSVNHRFLEVGLRLPEDLRLLDSEVRTRIAARCARGKVDCTLRFEATTRSATLLRVNTELAQQVVTAAAAVAALMTNAAPLNPLDVLRWPHVLEAPEVNFDELGATLLGLLEQALDELLANRDREGAKLKELVLARCAEMQAITGTMRQRVPEIIAALRGRHAAKIQDLAGALDPVRVEQESALLIQRLDVAEELDRLQTHLQEVQRVLHREEAVGRRLDFLMQELNREANTLGSKSAHIDSSSAAVDLKVLIEQIREQIQNLE
ncbi:MAG: YicC family protein [Gammaproteobacteria bacterium]|nr:YicC family protein [Gammaproteobacteria bacterium]